MCLQCLGIDTTATQSLAETWSRAINYIQTIFGLSFTTYSNCGNTPLFGGGQGSTMGPFLWLLCYFLIDSMKENIPKLHLTSCHRSISLATAGTSFVDDTGLAASAASK